MTEIMNKLNEHCYVGIVIAEFVNNRQEVLDTYFLRYKKNKMEADLDFVYRCASLDFKEGEDTLLFLDEWLAYKDSIKPTGNQPILLIEAKRIADELSSFEDLNEISQETYNSYIEECGYVNALKHLMQCVDGLPINALNHIEESLNRSTAFLDAMKEEGGDSLLPPVETPPVAAVELPNNFSI